MKAIWNDTIIAESEDTVLIEGNHYFPKTSLNQEFTIKSDTHSVCPWKGQASYFSIVIKDKINKDAVWYYTSPKEGAKAVKGRVAFWKGVNVID